ncbi:AraC family transcriptional regulator N-terminal domain-containing protein [Burkholderia pseudomallei]|uniref:AraC family transcriptional regulator n=1 Tax=Burkholderia pseudomallei TaxID=28450 RepID=UPI003F6566B2
MPSLTELRALIARHSKPDDIFRPLPGLAVASAHEPTQLFAYVVEPVISIVAQGGKHLVSGDSVFDYRAGQYLIVSVDLPVSGHITKATKKEPFLGVAYSLKSQEIAALLSEPGVHRKRQRAAPPNIAVGDLTEELLDPVVRLLRLLDRPQDIPVLAPGIEREILWRLINGAQGAMVRKVGLSDSRMTQINRTVYWIREHYAESLRVQELANLAEMSVTSFHRHFLRVTSLSPLQFQKRIRLQEARSRLLASTQEIAAVAFSVGYGSPSQFSREYRRFFGVPPGHDGLPKTKP